MTLAIIILSLIAFWINSQLYHHYFHQRSPWLSSPQSVRQSLLNNLNLQSGQIFAELGAGSGSLARQIAKRYPTNQIYAYEISYLPFLIGSLLAGRQPNLSFIRGDINKADLQLVDTFFIYTNRESLQTIYTKLSKYHKNQLLYSYKHQLTNQSAHQVLEAGKDSIYLYKL